MPSPAALLLLAISDRPIPYDADRERLTAEYLLAHRTGALTGDPAADTRMVPRVIVLHWTAGATAESAWQTFAPARLSGRPELRRGGELNVGAHYLVDRDGSVVRLAPDDRVMRHAIGLNHLAIGVENVGGTSDLPLTEAQVEADALLVRHLAGLHPITHLVGHFETRAFEEHPYFEERDAGYRSGKADPGDAFMDAVRARVADLGLLGPPP